MIEVRTTATFDAWLVKLRDPVARQRIQIRIRRLSLGNFGDVKPVGSGISELRIDWGPGYRVYLIQRGAVVVLCGGDKRSQKRDEKYAGRAGWLGWRAAVFHSTTAPKPRDIRAWRRPRGRPHQSPRGLHYELAASLEIES